MMMMKVSTVVRANQSKCSTRAGERKCVLDKAESTRGFGVPIESHDDSFDLPDTGEELVDLFL